MVLRGDSFIWIEHPNHSSIILTFFACKLHRILDYNEGKETGCGPLHIKYDLATRQARQAHFIFNSLITQGSHEKSKIRDAFRRSKLKTAADRTTGLFDQVKTLNICFKFQTCRVQGGN